VNKEKNNFDSNESKMSQSEINLRNDSLDLAQYQNIMEPNIRLLNFETYRLSLFRPYNKPGLLVRITKGIDKIILTTKYFYFQRPDGTGSDTILSEKNKEISLNQWIKFKSIIDQANFWKLKNDDFEGYIDFVCWKIEGKRFRDDSINEYHSVSKLGNDSLYISLGQYLLNLSGEKNLFNWAE
jgi:hypothetical protein